MKKKFSFSALLVYCCMITAQAQSSRFEKLILSIDADLQKQEELMPKERAQVFTDKKEYLAGETIWMNAFVHVSNAPSILSKTLYAELADYTGKIIAKKMLPVENGFAHADIQIPANLPSGAYMLNAYTMWMKNFPETLVQLPMVIIGTDFPSKPFLLQTTEATAVQAEFLPEGGCMAWGVETNFVVRLTGKEGLPVSDTFTVTENNQPVAAGRTGFNGMAFVNFTATKGRTLAVQSKAFTQSISLTAQPGISFKAVTNNASKIFLSLDKNNENSSNQFLVLGLCNDNICYQSTFDFTADATAAAVPRNKLPQGIIEFLVFDEKEMIVAARKVRNNPASSGLVQTSITGNKKTVTVTQPLKAGFITAVSTAEPVLYSPTVAAAANISLSDEYLAIQPSPFLGKKWSLPKPELKYIVESGITIRGKIAPFAGKPSEEGYEAELMIRGEDSTQAFAKAKTFSNGDFAVADIAFTRRATIYYQGFNPQRNKELLEIELFPSYFDTLTKSEINAVFRFSKEFQKKEVNAAVRSYLDSLYFNDPSFKPLDNVTVIGKKLNDFDSTRKVYASPVFDDGNALTILPKPNMISIWQLLTNSVPGLYITGNIINPDQVSFARYSGIPTLNETGGEDMAEYFTLEEPITFFLNEIQVDKSVISSVNVDDVAVIIINKQPFAVIGAPRGYIAVYTKKGGSDKNNLKSLASAKREGYSTTAQKHYNQFAEKKGNATIFYMSLKKQLFPLSIPYPARSIITLAGWNAEGKLVIETIPVH